ncbi:uncharacterized protein LOC134217037 [Armigeres subalbatus]|uniref:uncharacterized protein LOC134217037 n=1 Tax=Armigeres subalbatus TaxID=124917 RepID=UPI002ED16335
MYLQVLSVLFLVPMLAAVLVIDMQEYRGCPGHKYDIDLSSMEFDYDDDGFIIVSGNFTFLKDIVPPYPMYVYAEKMERGEWKRTFIDKYIPDFCSVIQNFNEIWYPITKNLNQKYCPFKAGFVAQINDNVRYKFPVTLTHNFVGEWRMIVECRDISEKNSESFGCWMQYASLIEI